MQIFLHFCRLWLHTASGGMLPRTFTILKYNFEALALSFHFLLLYSLSALNYRGKYSRFLQVSEVKNAFLLVAFECRTVTCNGV